MGEDALGPDAIFLTGLACFQGTQASELTFYRDTAGMCHLDRSPGHLDVRFSGTVGLDLAHIGVGQCGEVDDHVGLDLVGELDPFRAAEGADGGLGYGRDPGAERSCRAAAWLRAPAASPS